MNSKKIAFISLVAIILTWLSYWYNFGYLNDYSISNKPENWGVLGDFLGGVLNPILSFLTIVLLVSSLNVQRESNSHLKKEIEKSERFEKIRSFESTFFNMIDSQKNIFEKFSLKFKINNNLEELYSSSAVIELESILSEMKCVGAPFDQIKGAIKRFDNDDEIYSVVRTFCVIVNVTSKRLVSFTTHERKEYYETLINFTDYSLIRLVLYGYKYLDYPTFDSLNDPEFKEVLDDLGLTDYLNEI